MAITRSVRSTAVRIDGNVLVQFRFSAGMGASIADGIPSRGEALGPGERRVVAGRVGPGVLVRVGLVDDPAFAGQEAILQERQRELGDPAAAIASDSRAPMTRMSSDRGGGDGFMLP